MAQVKCPYRVPRNFHLLDELEMTEKSKYAKNAHFARLMNEVKHIFLGVSNYEDMTLSCWQASILTPISESIFVVSIKCSPRYPEEPPQMRFTKQGVRGDCVNSEGVIDVKKLISWKRTHYIMDALIAVRKYILKQCR